MRICLISDPYSPHWHLLIRHLLARGHQVIHLVYGPLPEDPIAPINEDFLTFSLLSDGNQTQSSAYKGSYTPVLSLSKHAFSVMRRLVPFVGRNLLEQAYASYVGYGNPPPPGKILSLLPKTVNSYLINLETCAARAQELLKQVAPDILLGSFMTNSGYIAARTGFRPFIAEAHGDDVLIKPEESLIMRMVLRYTLKRADCIRSHADWITQKMLTFSNSETGQKVETFPWGVDQQIFAPNRSRRIETRTRLGWQDNLILIMTRFFEPVYGIEYFIDALPSVVGKLPETRIILVGDGPLKEQLQHRISVNGLDGNVFFTGRVRCIEEMADYLNAADVYVSSSLSDGSSTSLQEAMACGLPVIVSDAPGNLEWVKDGVNGYIVPRRDSNTLSQRLITLLSQKSLRIEMGSHNLRLAKQKADFDRNLSRFEKMFASLVDRKRH